MDIQNSEIIVTINKDRNAPVFNVACYGIAGDLDEVIPLLIDEIQRIKELE